MIVLYQVEVDETETTLSKQEILDKCLNALSDALAPLGCYYDVGYNPTQVVTGKRS